MRIDEKGHASDSSLPFELHWTNTIFLALIHLGAIVLPIGFLLFGGSFELPEILIAVAMYFVSTFGITVGYHRFFSHRSYKVKPFLKAIFLATGSSAAEGSAMTWCSDHRRHHRYEDTPKDPYNVKRGFWWAHFLWLIGTKKTSDFSNIKDMTSDPLIVNQDRYYLVWLIVTGFVLPMMIGAIWGRAFETLILAGFVRSFFVLHVTWMINSYAHYFGRRPYSTRLTAKDSLLLAILAQGEGWHNYHHRFPFDYRNGHRFYHLDTTKWIIGGLRFLGLAWDLKRAPATEIFKARLEVQRDQLKQIEDPKLDGLHEALELALARWRQLSLEMASLKAERSEQWKEQKAKIQASVHQAKQDFMMAYKEWRAHFEMLQLQSA